MTNYFGHVDYELLFIFRQELMFVVLMYFFYCHERLDLNFV